MLTAGLREAGNRNGGGGGAPEQGGAEERYAEGGAGEGV